MTIKASTLIFEQYLEGQVNAIMAIRQLLFIDGNIARCAFNISTKDRIALRAASLNATKDVALKNSQLFRLFAPTKGQLSQVKAQKPLIALHFLSLKVKSCISSYCEAQRQCLLAIKSIHDNDKEVAKTLFRMDQASLEFLDTHTCCQLTINKWAKTFLFFYTR